MADEKQIAVYTSRDGMEIKLSFDVVRKYLVSGHPEFVTDQEIMLYAGTCKARGLNPFKKDCYLVKYTEHDAAATIVSIDYYRSRAKAQPDCTGWRCGVIVVAGPGMLEEREGSIVLEGEKLIGGWFRARPKGWDVDHYWSVPLERFVKKTRDGQPTRFWSPENQGGQIAKVAESQGLRQVWPDEFAKLYVKEEIGADFAVVSQPLKMPKAVETPSVAKPDSAEKEQPAAKRSVGRPRLTEVEKVGRQKQREEMSHIPAAVDKPPSEETIIPEQSANEIPWKDRLVLWVESVATPAEILATENFISQNLRRLQSKQEQLDVCLAWNRRQKEVREGQSDGQ